MHASCFDALIKILPAMCPDASPYCVAPPLVGVLPLATLTHLMPVLLHGHSLAQAT